MSNFATPEKFLRISAKELQGYGFIAEPMLLPAPGKPGKVMLVGPDWIYRGHTLLHVLTPELEAKLLAAAENPDAKPDLEPNAPPPRAKFVGVRTQVICVALEESEDFEALCREFDEDAALASLKGEDSVVNVFCSNENDALSYKHTGKRDG